MTKKTINILISVLFLLLIIACIIIVILLKKEAQAISSVPGYSGSESLGILGGYFLVFFAFLGGSLLLLELRHDLLYFLAPNDQAPGWKTVFNAVGLVTTLLFLFAIITPYAWIFPGFLLLWRLLYGIIIVIAQLK